jgi:hypothetical protein
MSDAEHRPTPSRSRHRWIAGSLLLALLIVIGYRLAGCENAPRKD